MDSEIDSSSFIPSIVEDSIETTSEKSRERSAIETWAHTREPKDGEPERRGKNLIFYCKYCSDPPYSATASNSFRYHLETIHGVKVESTPGPVQSATLDQLQQLYVRATSTDQTQQLDVQVLQKALDKDVIDEALVTLIVVQDLPFSIVEWPEFHAFCQVLNPEVKGNIITTHSEVIEKVEKLWLSHKDVLRKKLQSAISSVHLSLDIWTSPNKLLLLGICAHFVERIGEKLSNALIALRPVANHSGSEQFSTLLPVLQDYGIVRKVGSIVSDNASSNDTLCQKLGIYLQEEEAIEWDASYRRIRCIGHIINLAVQAFLFQNLIEIKRVEWYDEQEEIGEVGNEEEKRVTFRVMGPLGKLHNIIVHIRSSANHTKEFKTLAGRLIPLDNRTRWNGWYLMLVIATEKAGAIDTYSKNNFATLEKDYLSPSDWDQLRKIKAFLQPFHRATLETQGHNATIDRVLFAMDVLVRYFEKALSNHADDKEFSSRIRKGWEAFDKYYSQTDDCPLYAAALILHPSRRTKYIRANWEAKWQKPVLKKVKELWEFYRERSPSLPISLYERSPGQDQDLDVFDQIVQDLGKYAWPASQDEYEDYSNGEPYDIGKISALEWWCQDQQRRRWPRLSYMAIDILSIPTMSDEPEQAFSRGRRTVSWERAQLGAENIERVECLKHCIRSGIVKDELRIEPEA